MRKKVVKNTFGEAYTIKASYKANEKNNHWKTIEKTQLVESEHGVNEKNNHGEALRLFMEEHKHLNCLTVLVVAYQ
jgi:hypothetical protein